MPLRGFQFALIFWVKILNILIKWINNLRQELFYFVLELKKYSFPLSNPQAFSFDIVKPKSEIESDLANSLNVLFILER